MSVDVQPLRALLPGQPLFHTEGTVWIEDVVSDPDDPSGETPMQVQERVADTTPQFASLIVALVNAAPELLDGLQEERDRIADAIEAMRTYTCCGNFTPDYCETCRVTFECAAIARTGGKDATPPGPTNPEDSP